MVNENKSTYYLDLSDHLVFGAKLSTITFWIVAVMCIAYTVIEKIKQTPTRGYVTEWVIQLSLATGNVPQVQHRINKGNGATKLIITVVVLFVFTTLPQGILNLLAGVSETVFYKFYAYLGDLMDDLTLINSAINFLIYCIMSKKFIAIADFNEKMFPKFYRNKIWHPRNFALVKPVNFIQSFEGSVSTAVDVFLLIDFSFSIMSYKENATHTEESPMDIGGRSSNFEL
ncbi:hypothetical protein KUTeg_012665 [Tegillarca granosa]|uniref:G-protein coupled receptors family 1 profile domain-containing protein n=1 Tax=Tegillarca granosa TaxID=220873 RepID=A0ABQ9F5F8_TEGGR|nr:hypothetical protein KUTeg_012665 [Tegillarca granosa]